MSLNLDDLEFAQVKNNLKEFLRNQDEFTDFDLEGSAISVLLDTMAYAIHYTGIYANFSINEVFLDSAILRNSVIIRAKEMNYFPRQFASATAKIHLSITPTGSPLWIRIDKGTKFSGKIDNKNYNFITGETHQLNPDADGVYTGEMKIFDGTLFSETYTYNKERHLLSNAGVDDKHVQVTVNGQVWDRGNNILLENEDKWHFIHEDRDNKLAISFGDGVLSAEPDTGSTITVQYLITKNVMANNIGNFQMTSAGGSYPAKDFTVQTLTKSFGGAVPESIETIRKNAPKNFSAQSRAVTAEDFKALLINEFPDIRSINTWGGETNPIPQYGAVFITIKPKSTKFLTKVEEENIRKFLRPRSVVSVEVIFHDPNELFLDLVVTSSYNKLAGNNNPGDIQSLITDTVSQYFDNNLSTFDSDLKYSKLVCAIDASENTILGSEVKFEMAKIIEGQNKVLTFMIEMNNPITPHSIIGEWTAGIINYQLKDDGLGRMKVFQGNNLIDPNVGSVNYDTGIISLASFNAFQERKTIKVRATPVSNDIYVVRNSLLTLDKLEVIVNGI